MNSAAGDQFLQLFLLGALFGKLMEDTGSVAAIADFLMRRLGKSDEFGHATPSDSLAAKVQPRFIPRSGWRPDREHRDRGDELPNARHDVRSGRGTGRRRSVLTHPLR